jgi:hypothetical protein
MTRQFATVREFRKRLPGWITWRKNLTIVIDGQHQRAMDELARLQISS